MYYRVLSFLNKVEAVTVPGDINICRQSICPVIMTFKLWSPPGNKNAYKAQIAAKYVGVKLEQPSMEMGKTNKTPEFLKLNPFGKVRDLELPARGAMAGLHYTMCARFNQP